MSESDFTVRQKPRRAIPLADLKYLVRPPGKPSLVQAFPADELVEAQAWAAEHGGVVETLPLG